MKFNVDILLLDIEGTICPISFVKDELFPYFLNKAPEILKTLSYPLKQITGEDEISQINNILVGFPESITQDSTTLIGHLNDLVSKDIKDPTLKSLQGFIWKLGYEKGEIVAPIYDDAIEAIKNFKGKVYIYSSGSIKAQKLLFAYVKSDNGSVDLNGYLSGYFDITTSGFKQETSSYENILRDIGYAEKPSKVLFLSDNVNEVKAAIGARLNSLIVDRPGNNEVSTEDINQLGMIKQLDELTFEEN